MQVLIIKKNVVLDSQGPEEAQKKIITSTKQIVRKVFHKDHDQLKPVRFKKTNIFFNISRKMKRSASYFY